MLRRPFLLISLSLITLLGIGADLGWRMHLRPQMATQGDGQPLVASQDKGASAFSTFLARLMPKGEVLSNVAERLTVGPSAATDKRTALVAPVLVTATAITVNGRDVVAVQDDQAAQAVRDRILDEYKATILRDVTQVETVKFQETIAWRQKDVPTENIRTIEEAINILKLGTDKLVTYVVKSGDTGWDIARSYDVTTEQLAKANPTANLDMLQIGQVLNVTFKEPYVHTQSVSKRVVQERIPFTEQITKDANLWPWQYEVVTPGAAGTRQLTIREYREGGRVVRTEVLDNQVLVQPKTQVVKQGTRQIPAIGTGTLVYPVVGQTTSYYGPRWGSFHHGIDIGASLGAPVLAADSGMVIHRGWLGNYGNLIKIDHGGGRMVTWYGHLSGYNVKLGDTVKKGDVIGFVGNTGFSTGPHLHYEVHLDGSPVNPLQFYK